MSQTNWEAYKMLDVYIYDYLVKRDLKATAQAFQAEGKVSSVPVATDAPGGFLFEWWSLFWDIGKMHTQLMKAREQQQQQQHMQTQQLLLQSQAQLQQQQQQQLQLQQAQQQHQQQEQRREGGHLMNGIANGMGGNDPIMRREEKLKLLRQRDSLEDAALKQTFGDNVGQLMDPNQPLILKSAAAGQSSGQMLHGAAGGMSPQVQGWIQQFPGSTQDITPEINPFLNPRAAGPKGSLMGIPGSNLGGNNLTLKGWPLTGYDQLRSGLLQLPKSFMQGSQPFHQLQMSSPQHQQQNITSPSSSSELENRKRKMLLNNRSLSMGGRDALSSSGCDISSLQAGMPVLPRGDPEMQMRVTEKYASGYYSLDYIGLQLHQQRNSNQVQQHMLQQQHVLSGQQPQSSNHNIQTDNKIMGTSSITGDGSMSNSFRGNDQASKNQAGRKRKRPVSFSGPANSSGTANTAGVPSLSSAPSTPSTHTPGEMSMLALPHTGTSPKSLMMFGADNPGTLTPSSNQLWDDMDSFLDDVEDNVESFLFHDDADPET